MQNGKSLIAKDTASYKAGKNMNKQLAGQKMARKAKKVNRGSSGILNYLTPVRSV